MKCVFLVNRDSGGTPIYNTLRWSNADMWTCGREAEYVYDGRSLCSGHLMDVLHSELQQVSIRAHQETRIPVKGNASDKHHSG
jgi:hypothetical protein